MFREGEDKCFIEFVIFIEDGYCNLKGFGLEIEIMIISLVSVIEKVFLLDIKWKWFEWVSFCDSFVDKSNKFLSFFDFL